MSDPSPQPDNPDAQKPVGDGADDCFAPPKEPCECYCLHCQRVFSSAGIWFQKIINGDPRDDGFWMCPTPNCSGAGFTFDIFPTDPEHPANAGWTDEDGDEEVFFDEEGNEIEGPTEYDPTEPKYAQLDEQYGDDDDDIEGEEWKHGLEPGERPPEPAWVEEARQQWAEEQKRYDEPDQRPRVLDWSDRPKSPPRSTGSEEEIDDGDIPF